MQRKLIVSTFVLATAALVAITGITWRPNDAGASCNASACTDANFTGDYAVTIEAGNGDGAGVGILTSDGNGNVSGTLTVVQATSPVGTMTQCLIGTYPTGVSFPADGVLTLTTDTFESDCTTPAGSGTSTGVIVLHGNGEAFHGVQTNGDLLVKIAGYKQ